MSKHFFSKALTLTILVVAGLFSLSRLSSPLQLSISSVSTQKDTLFQVSHTAKVFASPDLATLQVGVVREGKTVAAAQADLNTANNAVIEAIGALGIEKEAIKTVSFSITPKYNYNRQTGQQRIDGYQASSALEVRSSDFDLVNKVIDASTEAGANTVGQVSFVVDDRDQHIAKARQEAMEGAKKKAEEIASEAGIALGRVVDAQVSEGGSQPPMYYERAMMMDTASEAGGTSIEPGQNEIQVTVQLFYELE